MSDEGASCHTKDARVYVSDSADLREREAN